MKKRKNNHLVLLLSLFFIFSCGTGDYVRMRVEMPRQTDISLKDFEEIAIANFLVAEEAKDFDLNKELREYFSTELDQKIKTAELFTGLLKEQYALPNLTPPYRLMYAEGMRDLLRSGLSHEYGLLLNPAENEWIVKIHTMADMISLPLDITLMSAVAENLNNPQWPVRLMAVYLLAGNPESGFDKVLEWVAQKDVNKYVREMAVVISGTSSGNLPSF